MAINYGLDGKVALVTGAGGGIGRAAAQVFARSGASVMVSDVNEAGGAETVALIEAAGGKAAFVRCDVSNADEVKAMVKATVDTFGGLDCAFNNAGINRVTDDQYDDAIWERDIAINLSGVMRCMREESAVMLERGGGAIVNTASINGLVGNGSQPAYTAAKHGVVGLARHGALRWAKNGIRVNAVCPGVIETPMTAPLVQNPEIKALMDSMTPMGRMGSAMEIAEAVVWLCSPAASFVTGHAMVVDGGATAF
ncbi:short-chain dehydrogenase/reductase SDR (plasmid) [Novosphingobium aromaticivorans DSM 12444]|uniref:Short-chain dehydrogenase/reductase SDR n=1 Tax=Novosphingobium aromaticivorans (strain ATCC 700278 / DSM 12444 / CCUG 56034 / CIP 105152 / NBRC 16084 / F199) TaxID=279238 RepID=A4XEZ8_NOVAD|nr:glucose 1-dehydrogenase [Novosphingobium aromaticivorans]ABP64509.1 short-chain dehydrogenase/reductase SDR [Novosphingobium aromaticivorans DSM 12444]SCY92787.1 NAD(P)-dependent dehydrogenase, short-chain alcohol dehydrogenase family [Novosphingobium aromaticivorans]